MFGGPAVLSLLFHLEAIPHPPMSLFHVLAALSHGRFEHWACLKGPPSLLRGGQPVCFAVPGEENRGAVDISGGAWGGRSIGKRGRLGHETFHCLVDPAVMTFPVSALVFQHLYSFHHLSHVVS